MFKMLANIWNFHAKVLFLIYSLSSAEGAKYVIKQCVSNVCCFLTRHRKKKINGKGVLRENEIVSEQATIKFSAITFIFSLPWNTRSKHNGT